MATTPERLTYSLAEACAMLGVHPKRAAANLALGRPLHPDVPAVKVWGRWHVPRAALDRLLCVSHDGAEPTAATG